MTDRNKTPAPTQEAVELHEDELDAAVGGATLREDVARYTENDSTGKKKGNVEFGIKDVAERSVADASGLSKRK